MTDAARPASQRRFLSPPAARRSRNAMSSQPPHRRSGHGRPSALRPSAPDKNPVVSTRDNTPAAFRPRRHLSDPSAILKSP